MLVTCTWCGTDAFVESYDATISNPNDVSLTNSTRVKTGIFGAMIGDTVVFGRNGGFALSGGIGIDFNRSASGLSRLTLAEPAVITIATPALARSRW